jgi:hypothetical protein
LGEHVGVHRQPDGALFDIVLLLHVVCVVAGLVTTVTAAATAARLRRLLGASVPLPDPVRRYFRTGVNWAGRSVWGIPVFGFALLALSQGAYGWHDGWVMSGLTIFVVIAFLAEGVLWPAERRVQVGVGALGGPAAATGAERADPVDLGRDASLMVQTASAAAVLLLVGTVLMIAQP